MSSINEILQHEAILHHIKKQTRDEQLVNYDITFDNWDIEYLYKEMVWVQRLDEPSAAFITRGQLVLPTTESKSPYAICKVLMVGPDTKKTKVGDFVLIPPVNIATSTQKIVDGYKTYFVREDGILAGVKYKGNPEDIAKDIQESVLS